MDKINIKQQLLKQKRQEIYAKIEEYVGHIDTKTMGYLSEMLQEYSKLHVKIIVEQKKNLEKKVSELKWKLESREPFKKYKRTHPAVIRPVQKKRELLVEDPIERDLILE